MFEGSDFTRDLPIFAHPLISSHHGLLDKNRDDDGADAFQVVDVSDGKIRTTQMNQRSKLKDAKNVDEFGEW